MNIFCRLNTWHTGGSNNLLLIRIGLSWGHLCPAPSSEHLSLAGRKHADKHATPPRGWVTSPLLLCYEFYTASFVVSLSLLHRDMLLCPSFMCSSAVLTSGRDRNRRTERNAESDGKNNEGRCERRRADAVGRSDWSSQFVKRPDKLFWTHRLLFCLLFLAWKQNKDTRLHSGPNTKRTLTISC